MFIDITGIDLFDQNAGTNKTQMFMDITDIDLLDQNVGMACAKVMPRAHPVADPGGGQGGHGPPPPSLACKK